MQFSNMIGEFTPGAAGVWSLVLMAAVWMAREWRETRKMSSEDRQARREGYEKEVENLRGENRQLRGEMTHMAEQHEIYRKLCHQETDSLRDRVVELENRLSGAFRKMADVAVRAARGEIDSTMAASILRLASEVEPEGHARRREEE